MSNTPANTGEIHPLRHDALLSADDVLPLVCMGRSTWMNGVRAGKFPQPIRLSPRRPRWKRSDIDALIASA